MKEIRNYLPSGRFVSITSALLFSAALIAGASWGTAPHNSASLDVSPEAAQVDSNWQATLDSIQTNNASTSLPSAPDPQTVAMQLAQAKTPSMTETVSRALAISLANAKQQGLGNDTVSQDGIIKQALGQAQLEAPTPHTLSDLTIVDDATTTLHAYGNAVIATMTAHSDANSYTVLTVLTKEADTGNASLLKQLPPIGNAYGALAKDLLAVPTPRSLASFHLLLVNDMFATAALFPNLSAIPTDPMRGLLAVQQLNTLYSEEKRVLINMAGQFKNQSILFTKDEPGAVWGLLSNTQ